jgi:phosphoribosylformylglycinamidine (FGAM) synthase PurS component
VDGKAQGTYLGHIPLGQLVALPPEVDLKSLDLSPQGYAIARALQDYGTYDVDSGGAFAIYVEPTAANDLGKAEEDLRRIRPLLRCVTNNRPDFAGGGGPNALRRALKAPPFTE